MIGLNPIPYEVCWDGVTDCKYKIDVEGRVMSCKSPWGQWQIKFDTSRLGRGSKSLLIDEIA
jgi:hypothetical protein